MLRKDPQNPGATGKNMGRPAPPPVYQPMPARELVQAKMVQHGVVSVIPSRAPVPPAYLNGVSRPAAKLQFVGHPNRQHTPPPPSGHIARDAAIQPMAKSWYGLSK